MDDIAESPGITVAIGGIDAGKTTFCALLANHAMQSGLSVAVVDGDMGQSEIGPPTTVGLGIVESPIKSIGELEPRALYFIGSTSPFGYLLATTVGVKLLTEKALCLKKQLIVVDTTGLIVGTAARKLKTHKIELLHAGHIVAIQKTDEAEHILQLFDSCECCRVHRLTPSPHVKPKSQTLRTQRRATRFHEYFEDGHTHDISLREMATAGTWLRTGRPLEPQFLEFASGPLRTGVLYGEWVGRTVYLVTERDYDKRGIEELQEGFGTSSAVVVPASRYANLIVGLSGKHLGLLALGILAGVDFRSGIVRVYTPLRSVAPVRSLRFGVLKLRTDGTEIGRIRPGEI
jgi:polynucleotide 5'-hydroxyl-kinase GRC3/NOL9